MKRFIAIFVLVFSISFVAIAQSKEDNSLLDFISNLYNGKIEYTTDNFIKQGFVDSETFWNNQFVSVFTVHEDHIAQFIFKQTPSVSIDVYNPSNNKTEDITPNKMLYFKDWKIFLDYFLEHYKLVSYENNVYRFGKFKIVNVPEDCFFFIMNYGLDE